MLYLRSQSSLAFLCAFSLIAGSLTATESQFRLAPREIEAPYFQLTAQYPTCCHRLVSISDTGKTFEMEDGSHWAVVSGNSSLYSWKTGDNLVITPNNNWCSSGNYYITNKTNNSYVRANLHIGPMKFGSYSHWITNIDYDSGYILLENGVTWYTADESILNDWMVNDHIILGLYDNWLDWHNWVNYHDHILINVNTDKYVRARQY